VAAGTNEWPAAWTILKEMGMDMEWIKPGVLLGSLVYALLGVVIFWVSFIIIDKLTPYNLWEEIVEKQNRALGMVVAAMSLGICIIVAAAIH
jgi:putative membrane protein